LEEGGDGRVRLRTTTHTCHPHRRRPPGRIPASPICLIKAYPFSSADANERVLGLLHDRGVPPAFLHMDVGWHRVAPGDFARDLRRLQAVCARQQICSA
jgi:hypothetical protein